MENLVFSGLKEKKYNRPSIEFGVDIWNFEFIIRKLRSWFVKNLELCPFFFHSYPFNISTPKSILGRLYFFSFSPENTRFSNFLSWNSLFILRLSNLTLILLTKSYFILYFNFFQTHIWRISKYISIDSHNSRSAHTKI